jgi:hypothetical protein
MPGSIEYSLVAACPHEQVWTTLLDWQSWPEWKRVEGVYGKVLWKEGEPWVVGSRFVFEHRMKIGPFPVSFDANMLIVKVRPQEEVVWINHGAGITVQQSTELAGAGPYETLISTRAEFLGSVLKDAPPGIDADGILRKLICNFYDALAEESVRRYDLIRHRPSALR